MSAIWRDLCQVDVEFKPIVDLLMILEYDEENKNRTSVHYFLCKRIRVCVNESTLHTY